MDGGYQVINNNDGLIYSHVIEFKNCEVGVYQNGEIKNIFHFNKDGIKDGLWIEWTQEGKKKSRNTCKREWRNL